METSEERSVWQGYLAADVVNLEDFDGVVSSAAKCRHTMYIHNFATVPCKHLDIMINEFGRFLNPTDDNRCAVFSGH